MWFDLLKEYFYIFFLKKTTKQLPEELTLDYAEITSIPPLPLWTLLAADRELSQSAQNAEEKKVRNIAATLFDFCFETIYGFFFDSNFRITMIYSIRI